jgi:2,4-dienoyl-CoA reductase-like NADH-dependent reductase (Old Yellow Enzyme family)/thioredoxin reductase
MPPMVTNFADQSGCITKKQIDYYLQRATGGVGYITFEHTSISRQGKLTRHVAMIAQETHTMHLKKLVDAVHRERCPIVVQINHAGRQTSSAITGEPIVAPSPIPCPVRKEIPKPLNFQEIEKLVQQFAQAAERVRQAEADGVEIQMGHGSLICSFLSPFSNKRRDDYGGNREKRGRFALEILRAVRERVGREYPVICRMSLSEYVQGGLEIEDTKFYARLFEENGASALHLSAASAVSIQMNHPPYYVKEGVFVPFAAEIKKLVKIPVIAVGRIRDPHHAEKILKERKADFITMGRALISDPFLPQKAFDGGFDDIVPCISCNRCIKSIRVGSLACTVNPGIGKEGKGAPQKAEYSKRVMVVGGGPGGMKAAQVAAQKGHQVTLYEKKGKLGGMVRMGSKPPQKDVLIEYIDYQCRQLEKLPVDIKRNTFVTPEMIEKIQPDAIIMATGSRQMLPDIPGINKINIVFIEDVLSEAVDLGNHSVVIGGGEIGAEVADFVSEKGIRVTLVEKEEDIVMDLVAHLSYFLKKRLRDKKARILTSAQLIGFDDHSILIKDAEGVQKITDHDSVILAAGFKSERALMEGMYGKIEEIHLIGDAKAPREIIDAVEEGYEVGAKL